ncbi:SH3 domain-binding protein 1, partial [Geodia barretti]
MSCTPSSCPPSSELADTSTTLQKMKDLLSQLPPSHNATLKYLLAFLHEFAQYHEMTKMTTGNIAIVMGPNLLWPEGDMSEDAALVVFLTILHGRLIKHAIFLLPLIYCVCIIYTLSSLSLFSLPPLSPSSLSLFSLPLLPPSSPS